MKDNLAVIFDMDGVIVDSNPVHKKSIQVFCERHGIEVDETFLRERVYGRTNSEWIPELFGNVSKQQIKSLSREKEQLFREMFNPEKFAVKGLFTLIRELESHEIDMAVATSAPVENEHYILERLSIRDSFKAILHSAHVKRGKPAPDIYKKAAEQLGQHPENCIVFEDSVPGATAAKEAGCYTVGIATTYTSGDLELCHRVISNFTGVDYQELIDWLEAYHSKVI